MSDGRNGLPRECIDGGPATGVLWVDSKALDHAPGCLHFCACSELDKTLSRVLCCHCTKCEAKPTAPCLAFSPNGEVTCTDQRYKIVVFSSRLQRPRGNLIEVRRHASCPSYPTRSSFLFHCGQQGLKPLNKADRYMGILLLIFIVGKWLLYPAPLAYNSVRVFEKKICLIEKVFERLRNNPGGIKLHQDTIEITAYLATYMLRVWYTCLQPVISRPIMLEVMVATCAAVGGMSCAVALLRDLVFVFQMYIFVFQAYSSRAMMLVRTLLFNTLLTFIRGQRSPFTGVEDPSSWFYVDELFVFALLLTICAFLLPTLFMCYLVFLVFRLFFVIIDCLLCFGLYMPVLWLSRSVSETHWEMIELRQGRLTASDCWNRGSEGLMCLEYQQLLNTMTTPRCFVVHVYSLGAILSDVIHLREVRSRKRKYLVFM